MRILPVAYRGEALNRGIEFQQVEDGPWFRLDARKDLWEHFESVDLEYLAAVSILASRLEDEEARELAFLYAPRVVLKLAWPWTLTGAQVDLQIAGICERGLDRLRKLAPSDCGGLAGEAVPLPGADAPEGFLWKCPACTSRASHGRDAMAHAAATGHPNPTLEAIPELSDVIRCGWCERQIWERESTDDFADAVKAHIQNCAGSVVSGPLEPILRHRGSRREPEPVAQLGVNGVCLSWPIKASPEQQALVDRWTGIVAQELARLRPAIVLTEEEVQYGQQLRLDDGPE